MDAAFITFALSRRGGGLPPAMSGLARGLQRCGTTVSIAGLADPDLDADRGLWSSAPVTAYRSRGPGRLGWSPSWWWQARTAARPSDVVHAHGIWSWPLAAATTLARRHGLPLIISPHGMCDPWIVSRGRMQKHLARRWFVHAAFRQAAVIHALSLAEAHAVRAFWPTARIAIIPNGVDLPDSTAVASARPWPADGRMTLLFLGRLHPKKGVLELVEAVALACAADPGLRGTLRVAIAGWGEGDYPQRIQNAVKQAGLIDTVWLLGEVFGAAKAAALRHADAFILPSHGEGLPMAALEAAAHGLPLLLTAGCNLPEFAAADAAWPITPVPAELARRLAAFVTLTAAERSAIGARALVLAKQQFTWDSVAQRMNELYAWTRGQGTPPTCLWDG